MVDPLVELFPGLTRGGYRSTSPKDKKYNCIAHAAADDGRWWGPTPLNVNEVFWPAGWRVASASAFRAGRKATPE